MAYSSLNFCGYEDLTRDLDRGYELDDRTLRAMVHSENADFFDAMGKIVSRYAAAKDEQRLIAFFAMIQDGCNDCIDILSENIPVPSVPPGDQRS